MYARTPFISQVNESGQTGAKVEIFISNTSTFPVTPNYTLEKSNPSLTNNVVRFNITPYVREFIKNTYQNIRTLPNPATLTPNAHSAFVQIKRYKIVSGITTLLDTRTFKSFDGYRNYTDSTFFPTIPFNNEINTFNASFPLYFYPTGMIFFYLGSAAASTPSGLLSPGYITVYLAPNSYVKYISLANPAITETTDLDAVNQRFVDIPVVYQSASFPNTNFFFKGNIIEFYTASDVLLQSFTFKPLDECRYTPIPIDFINKAGGWQRVFFFKASNDKMNFTSEDYNFLTDVPTATPNQWEVSDGQTRQMNRNARRKITVNSGSVEENFKFILEQLLLSERVIVNGLPAKILTSDIDLIKTVNRKDLNYTLEFEFAYDEISTIY